MTTKNFSWLVVGIVVILISVAPAYAYAPIGAGLSAIGSFIAVVVAVLLAIVGFIWYPIKRLIVFLDKAVRRDPRP